MVLSIRVVIIIKKKCYAHFLIEGRVIGGKPNAEKMVLLEVERPETFMEREFCDGLKSLPENLHSLGSLPRPLTFNTSIHYKRE